ncbi:MAG: hypothetical protein ACUVUR_06185 [bacterium]
MNQLHFWGGSPQTEGSGSLFLISSKISLAGRTAVPYGYSGGGSG